MNRISAEFESPELAEFALKRIKESVNGIHSTNIFYNKKSDRAVRLRNASIYTIIPTAVTTHTYFTAVMESSASEDVIEEPFRNRKATACVFCDSKSISSVHAIMSALGGVKIRTPEN